MPVRMYDEVAGVDRKVYGFVLKDGYVYAVCYDSGGNGYTVSAGSLRPVE